MFWLKSQPDRLIDYPEIARQQILIFNLKNMIKISLLKSIAICISMLATNSLFSQQEIIYQQNFDGNNGTFTNTILSAVTANNKWLSSSTDTQYGNYRHVWNFSNDAAGGNPNVMPISGRSLGIGFFNGNNPNVPNQPFRTWDGTTIPNPPFYTTRWAHVGISTVGYKNITVEFKWRCTGEVDAGKIYDYGTVNTSIDGGASWAMDQSGGQGGVTSEHGTFDGGLYYGNSGVQTTILTLPANRGNQANFRLAFRMVVDEGYGTGGGFIIDDIIVRGEKLLATSETVKSTIDAYKDGTDFVVKSPNKNILQVDVYDISGKMAGSHKANSKEVRFNAISLAKGIYIVKAKLENGEELARKLRN